MRRNVIGILGMLLIIGIQPAFSQESSVDITPALSEVKSLLSDADYQVFSEKVQNMYFGESDGVARKTASVFRIYAVYCCRVSIRLG